MVTEVIAGLAPHLFSFFLSTAEAPDTQTLNPGSQAITLHHPTSSNLNP